MEWIWWHKIAQSSVKKIGGFKCDSQNKVHPVPLTKNSVTTSNQLLRATDLPTSQHFLIHHNTDKKSGYNEYPGYHEHTSVYMKVFVVSGTALLCSTCTEHTSEHTDGIFITHHPICFSDLSCLTQSTTPTSNLFLRIVWFIWGSNNGYCSFRKFLLQTLLLGSVKMRVLL